MQCVRATPFGVPVVPEEYEYGNKASVVFGPDILDMGTRPRSASCASMHLSP